MKMIVGLGNPGPKYELTHHNAGFWVIDNIAEELGVRCSKAEKQALTAQVMYRGEKLLLVKPQSYMNLSGHPVRDLMHFYKIDIEDLLVIYDDMDLEPGALRLRRNGSCGGHNGMRSIIEQLGTDNICRIKLGIGRSKGGAVDHVLGRISKAEEQIFSDAVLKVAEAAAAAGATAVALTAPLPGMAIDIEKRQPILGRGWGRLSGPAVKPLALHMVHQLSKNLRLPVIGMGGIACGTDAVEFMMAGACAFQVGAANVHDPLIAPRILSELNEWLDDHGVRNVNEIVGVIA